MHRCPQTISSSSEKVPGLADLVRQIQTETAPGLASHVGCHRFLFSEEATTLTRWREFLPESQGQNLAFTAFLCAEFSRVGVEGLGLVGTDRGVRVVVLDEHGERAEGQRLPSNAAPLVAAAFSVTLAGERAPRQGEAPFPER